MKKAHFVGINLQAVMDGNMRVINAFVNELHEQATATAIRKIIVSYLAKLGI